MRLFLIFLLLFSLCASSLTVSAQLQSAGKAESESLARKLENAMLKKQELEESLDIGRLRALKQALRDAQDSVMDLQTRKSEMLISINDKQALLGNAKGNIANMGVYSDIKKKKELEENLKKLSEMPFSLLTPSILDELDRSSDEYLGLEDYGIYKQSLLAARKGRRLYDDSNTILEHPYDSLEIRRARIEIQKALKIKKNEPDKGIYALTPVQYGEMDTLDIRLSRYKTGIAELKKTVHNVNSNETIVLMREQKGDSREIITLLQTIIFPTDAEAVARRMKYIEMIPNLNRLLSEYWEELKGNPFANTKTEIKILDL